MKRYLSMEESIRYAVIEQYVNKKMGLAECVERLKIHRSTFLRSVAKYRKDGVLGLAHGLRGRASNRHYPDKIKEQILELYQKEYQPHGFGIKHFYEDAKNRFIATVSYKTVWRWLRTENIVTASRRSRKHRSRRPRKECFGEMLQMDTSIHDWLSNGQKLALVSCMDDCTNHICGAFLAEKDTTLANMQVLESVFTTYGLPIAIYTDRSAIFKVTRTSEGRVITPKHQSQYRTQVQKRLEKLGVELIYAYSPQAKGRIERSFRIWQTRLIPELKKNNITTIEAANRYIQKQFVPDFNMRFAQNPKEYGNAFIHIEKSQIRENLIERYEHIVPNDHVILSKGAQVCIKILPCLGRQSFAKAKVEIIKYTNDSIRVQYKGESLRFEAICV